MTAARISATLLCALLISASMPAQSAIEFVSAANITLPWRVDLFTADATIECWVRTPHPPVTSDCTVFRKGPENLGSSIFYHRELTLNADGSITFIYTGSPFYYRSPASLIPMDGMWHHVALQRNLDNTFQLWLDGHNALAAGPGPCTWYGCAIRGSNVLCNAPVCVESYVSSSNHWALDSIRISSTARYQSSFAPRARWTPDNSTLLLLLLDEAQGNSTRDEVTGQPALLGGLYAWIPGKGGISPASSPRGTACGPNGGPQLAPLSLPTTGQTFRFRCTNGTPFAPALNLVGLSSHWQGSPLPVDLASFGMLGCHFYTSADLSWPAVTDASGSFDSTLYIPYSLDVLGRAFGTQTLVGSLPANPVGVAASNWLDSLVGNQ